MDIFTINASNLFSRILTNITLTILVLFGFIFTSFAQYSTSIDTLNCVGGTTTFVDRLTASLGIHASQVKIVSVYEGSLVVNYEIEPEEGQTLEILEQ